jgi:5'-3' exoribonuclease 4
MGIPSYYRKLLRSCPHLIRSDKPSGGSEAKIGWLFMDYNCLIYHCLYRPDAPVYPSMAETDPSVKTAWEEEFIASVLDYTVHVIRQVGAEKGVYIAVDGVVPMAKMRQQRLRRFKSSWLADQGIGRGGSRDNEEREVGPRWNTNAITPGTEFMDRLHAGLLRMVEKEGKTGVWRVSSCREWGEGEHKIMAEWRRAHRGSGDGMVIYGLDADLIVLSLLASETEGFTGGTWLFREAMERGSVQYDLFGEEMYEWFSVDVLREWLIQSLPSARGGVRAGKEMERAFVLDYTCMMSFLGNDFLPASLSYKMRDDGHTVLLNMLHRQFAEGVRLVGREEEGYPVRVEGLLVWIQALARDEEERIQEAVLKKRRMAEQSFTVEEMGRVGHEDWPLFKMEEAVLLWKGHGRPRLDRQWRERYLTHFFPGFPDHASSRADLARRYLYGIQWVWAYYMGRMEDVCFEWFYPFSLPPLWSWLVEEMAQSGMPPFAGTVQVRGSDIQPCEQLALVLPVESWSLLPPCPQRALPYRAPHLFPTEFSFDSVGKRFFWECESMIPIPTIREIKGWCL